MDDLTATRTRRRRGVSTLALLFISCLPLAAEEPLRVVAYGSDRSAFFAIDESGEPSGLEFKILESFSRSLGRSLEVVHAESFKHVFVALDSRTIDIAAATLTITPDRLRDYTFSTSYFPVRTVLVARRGESTTSFDALDGARVGVIEKSTHEDFLSTIPGVERVFAPTTCALFELLDAGEIDAVLTDTALALPRLQDYPRLEVTLYTSRTDYLAFAMPKGSVLAEPLSSYIELLRGSETYFDWVGEFFGTNAKEIVRAGFDRSRH